MFEFIKKIFIGLLTSTVSTSNHTKCVSLSNQKCNRSLEAAVLRCLMHPTLLKKRLWYRCFPESFVKFLRTPIFIEHLWWLLPIVVVV